MNNQLVRALLANQKAWEFVSFESQALAPRAFRQEWVLA
jgi:UDP-3-O-[3-hydroxymyristoyl] N-acetylglucosamine deacetylase